MENDDDFDLPTLPDNLPAIREDSLFEEGDSSVPPTQLCNHPLALNLREKDLEEMETSKTNKHVFLKEMACYDVYQYNLHSCFKNVISVKGVIALVGAGMALQRQRRASVQHFSEQCRTTTSTQEIEYDVLGNAVKKA